MSYQALLFCPDEKTARVVSQVLSELEFSVEPCNEPFAAVKKLMVQHFDAIVVDCDNEQNAALLFKSARNSGSNQTSLAVAVVEGQAGVAKAFRLGANLVLTKPIHVEQSKGTLRVARGLLRKGQAAKPTAAIPSFPEAVTAPPVSMSAPVPVPATFPPPRAVAPPVASAAAFELDAEPAPRPDTVDAALLEYMPDSPSSSVENLDESATGSNQSKQYPWQPSSKPMAEPMASALRRAAEAAGKTEFENPAASHSSASQTSAPQIGSGAAAAPARAREIAQLQPQPKITPFESKPAVAARPSREHSVEESHFEVPAAEIRGAHAPVQAPQAQAAQAQSAQAPSFASLEDGNAFAQPQQAADAGGSKKTILIAVVLIGVAAAGYFGWTRTQSKESQPAPHAVAPVETGAASLPPSGTEVQPPATADVVQPIGQASSFPGAPSSTKPSAAVMAQLPGAKIGSATPTTEIENPAPEVNQPKTAETEAAPALIVKNSAPAQPKVEAAVQEPEAPPTASSIATGTDNSALTGIVNTNAINAQKAPQQTLRISQGVSQGLVLKRVQPVYTAQARQMHLEGKVELQANISKTGSITGVKQLSGDAILGRSAIEAVQQWKYKPYFLNGEPVEIQTQITVNFKLP
jgi:periplasmic protein TonB